MSQWFVIAWGILVFRRGPQDLPAAREWTILAGGIYLLSGLALLHLRGVGREILPMLGLDLFLVSAFMYLLLQLMERGARLWQSLQALWLCGACLNVMALPFASSLANPPDDPGLWLELAVIMSLSLVFWSIALMGHVIRHALEWPFGRALILALAYAVSNILIHFQLFSPNG